MDDISTQVGLEKKISITDVDCGKCITTTYFDGNTLVRQDVEIVVDAQFLTKLMAGDN